MQIKKTYEDYFLRSKQLAYDYIIENVETLHEAYYFVEGIEESFPIDSQNNLFLKTDPPNIIKFTEKDKIIYEFEIVTNKEGTIIEMLIVRSNNLQSTFDFIEEKVSGNLQLEDVIDTIYLIVSAITQFTDENYLLN